MASTCRINDPECKQYAEFLQKENEFLDSVYGDGIETVFYLNDDEWDSLQENLNKPPEPKEGLCELLRRPIGKRR